jgi:hypothetical protein
MTALEQELEAELDKGLAEAPPLRLAPKKEQSLLGQWSILEKIEVELRSRIRREEIDIRTTYDAVFARINSDYDLRISDAVATLESKRKMELRQLIDDTAERLRDHETLKRGRLA